MTEPKSSVADDGPVIRAAALLPGIAPARVLLAFTNPDVLARWWGGDVTSSLEPGGPYTVSFAAIGRVITGEVVAYQAGSHLVYTWVWDGEPDPVRRTVSVTVAPDAAGDGTLLTIIHGPHGVGEREETARREHREGWEYFLPRIVSVLTGANE